MEKNFKVALVAHLSAPLNENPSFEAPHSFEIPSQVYPLTSEFQLKEPFLPSEILKAVHGIGMDIFWNRPIGSPPPWLLTYANVVKISLQV